MERWLARKINSQKRVEICEYTLTRFNYPIYSHYTYINGMITNCKPERRDHCLREFYRNRKKISYILKNKKKKPAELMRLGKNLAVFVVS